MRQPSFSRSASFVAVQHIRLSADTILEPGEAIEGLRMFHLRDLHRRRKIGPAGDPWTESMLAHAGDRLHRPERAAIHHPDLKSQVPGAVEPFMHQDAEGQWVLGDGQAFGTLDEALAAWHNSVGTEDPTDDQDEPEDDFLDDETDETDEPDEPDAPTDEPKEGEPAKEVSQATPEPTKAGSQWSIEGVDGKFSSAKKAREAWDLAHDPLEN